MNDKLVLQDIVILLAKKANITQKEADRFYREFVQLILECIYKNDSVKIKDFGTFKLVSINERESVNVNTGEKIIIPAHYKMSFTPDRSLKKIVNKPFAHFDSVIIDDDIEWSTTQDKSTNSEEEFLPEPVEDENIEREILVSENTDSPEYVPIQSSDEKEEDDDKSSVYDDESESLNNTEKDELLDIDDNILSDMDKMKGMSLLPDNEEYLEESWGLDKKDDLKFASKQNEEKDLLEPLINDSSDRMFSPNEDMETGNEQSSSFEKELGIDNEDDISDKTQVEDKDYSFSYNSYEQKTVATKIKQKLPLILFIGGVMCFVVYKVAQLLDFTPDYEYYVGRTKNLSLTDTLPYLNDNTSTFEILDTVIIAQSTSISQTEVENNVVEPEDTEEISDSYRVLDNETQLPIPINDSITIDSKTNVINEQSSGEKEQIGNTPQNLEKNMVKWKRKIPLQVQVDERKLIAESGYDTAAAKRSYKISEGLNLKIVNKAGLYIKNRSQKYEFGNIILE